MSSALWQCQNLHTPSQQAHLQLRGRRSMPERNRLRERPAAVGISAQHDTRPYSRADGSHRGGVGQRVTLPRDLRALQAHQDEPVEAFMV